MNIKQLKSALKPLFKKEKYPVQLRHPWDLFKFAYNDYFEVVLPAESYCLEKRSAKWEVYYAERGAKFDVKEFSSETEACEYLYKLLLQTVGK